MVDGKAIVFATVISLAAAAFGTGGTAVSAVQNANGRDARSPSADARERVPPVDAHKPVTYHFAVTNTADKTQTVESVRTSCACLKVAVATSATLPPEGVVPFEVVFNPAGMEGPVQKRVWVTLAPSKKIVTFDISENVRLRLGFKPMDAAFGVIRRSETGREIVAKLAGYAADAATLGEPFLATKNTENTKGFDGLCGLCDLCGKNHNGTNSLRLCASALKKQNAIFDVRLAHDGKAIVAKFRDRNVLPGIYAETWTIPTSDSEIPEIKFAVSARVADAVSVTPQVITVGWDEPVCSRMVMVRAGGSRSRATANGRDARSPSADARERVPPLRILSASTKLRKWGDVMISQRPLNGWRIDIENIDPREVRQFSKRPFLEVKTNLPGMESFEIPLRVVQNGGTE